MKNKEYLDVKAISILLILTLLWGLNYSVIKYSTQGMSPVFTSAVRSLLASIFGIIYCLWKKEQLFHTDIRLFHGFMVGLLFGLEFACVYFGMLYTDSVRSVLFVYLSPFIVAAGAHFFLKGDRLTLLKACGLLLAFTGVLIVFWGKPKTASPDMLFGDLLEIAAGFFWGATTLYIKKFMAEKVQPINTFLYQLVFSIPILFGVSLILEPQWIYRIDLPILLSLLFQSFIIAFVSYLIWFKLIHQYSVSRLSVFTFFTPIFGVLFGVIFLNEDLTVSLMIGLPLVSLGIFLVNWRRRAVS
jgi:drug/metabolite transporter (DMT)-like permease